ncbi:hypothetical protein KI387_012434, partial [Taxus chinensis]
MAVLMKFISLAVKFDQIFPCFSFKRSHLQTVGLRFDGVSNTNHMLSICTGMKKASYSCSSQAKPEGPSLIDILMQNMAKPKSDRSSAVYDQVSVLWDVGNCGICPSSPPPSPSLVYQNVEKYLHNHGIREPITDIVVYGEADTIPQVHVILREIGIHYCPDSWIKNSVFTNILRGLWNNVAYPSTALIFLISANKDFARALFKLEERGYPSVAAQLNDKAEVLEWPETSTLSKTGLVQDTSEYEPTSENEKELNKNSEPTSCESKSSAVGELAIFWDLRRCPVPKGVPYDTVAANIKCFLTRNGIHDQITTFNVYGDASKLPKAFIKGCSKTGIDLIDEKDEDSVQKTMLVDMIVSATDHVGGYDPYKLLIITARKLRDFSPFLWCLQNHRRELLVAVPNLKRKCTVMKEADYAWKWPEMAMAGYT